LEPFAEALLEPRNAGATYAEERCGLLQGGMSQGGQEDGLGSTQLLCVGSFGNHGAGLENKRRIDPAGS